MVDKNKPQQEKRGGWLSRFAPGVRKIVSRRDTPDNLWVKDPDTGEMLYRSDLEASLWVTPSGRHMRIDAPTRLRFTFDDGKYEAVDTPDVPEDPLKFSDGKSYKDRLNAARKAAGRKDTMAIGFGEVGGQEAVVVVQDFTFMGGSLGMAAGEAFIKAAREAVGRQFVRALPFARASRTDPASTRSSKEITSALMKPFSKSVWITPAAFGAVSPLRIVQARASFGPAVR